MQHQIARNYDLFINNEWHRSSSNAVLEVRSPLTDELLCTVPNASERDVVEAVIAAKAAGRPGMVWACANAPRRSLRWPIG